MLNIKYEMIPLFLLVSKSNPAVLTQVLHRPQQRLILDIVSKLAIVNQLEFLDAL